MEYLILCNLYDKLEGTSKRLEKTFYLANFLKSIKTEDASDILLLLEGKIFPDSDDQKMGVSDSIVIKAIMASTGANQQQIESLWKNTGDLGIAVQETMSKKRQMSLFRQDVTVKRIVSNLKKVATLEGAGTVNQKVSFISDLLNSADPKEAKYLVRTILNALRIGISSGTIRDAIAWSVLYDFPEEFPDDDYLKNIAEHRTRSSQEKNFDYNTIIDDIDYAYSIVNDFGIILRKIREEGFDSLRKVEPSLGNPLKVMLYQKVKSVDDAFAQVGRPAAIEYKYDGFRIQVHKSGDSIRIFTRSLDDVSEQFPEIIEYAKENILADDVIIDGEAVGYDTVSKRYLPFQKISQRIKRKYDIDGMKSQITVEWTIFDVLYYGRSVLSTPFHERRKIIEKIVKVEDKRVVLSKILITDDSERAKAFYHQALSDKQEGVMFKNLDAIYVPGSRVGTGVKLKPIMDPLDLVIVGAEWGEGKRASWFTSFILACRSASGELLEIGRVGTGFKEINGETASADGTSSSDDEGYVSFEDLTNQLKPLITREKGKEAQVRPKIVLEIAFEEIQKSNSYSSGFALRFPRVLRLRPEKPIDEISTIEDVMRYYHDQ